MCIYTYNCVSTMKAKFYPFFFFLASSFFFGKFLRLLFFFSFCILCSLLTKASFCKRPQLNPLAVAWRVFISEVVLLTAYCTEQRASGWESGGPGASIFSLVLLLTQYPSGFNILSQVANLG